MQRSPLHNCWATATPSTCSFINRSVFRCTLYTVVREENQKILSQEFISVNLETQTVAILHAGGCPPKTQTILNKYQTLILQELFENNWELITQLRQVHVLPTALCLELPGTAHLQWIWELCKPCVSLWLLLCSPCHGGMTTRSFKMLQHNKVFALNNIIAHDAKTFVGFTLNCESNRKVACNFGAAIYTQWVDGGNYKRICLINQHKEIQL